MMQLSWLKLLLDKRFIIGLAIAACVAIVFFAGTGYQKAKSEKVIAELRLEHEKILQDIKDKNQDAIDEKQAQINNLQLEFSIADEKYAEDIKNAEDKIAKRDADLRAMRSVQSVKIKPVVCGANGKDNHQQTTHEVKYAELDTEVAIGAYRVTDDGDRAIRQLTELQDRVRALATVCPIAFID